MNTERIQRPGCVTYCKAEEIQHCVSDSVESAEGGPAQALPIQDILKKRHLSSIDFGEDLYSLREKSEKESANRCDIVNDQGSQGYKTAGRTQLKRKKSVLSVSNHKERPLFLGQFADAKEDICERTKTVDTAFNSIGNKDLSSSVVGLVSCGCQFRILKESSEKRSANITINSVDNSTKGENIPLFCLIRKRLPSLDIKGTLDTKKYKKDFKEGMMNSSEMGKSLKIESELEISRCNTPFKKRDIDTIVEELELISGKWKEGYAKYKFPTKWGIAIVKNCSEKWDSQYIPPKILDRYRSLRAMSQSSKSQNKRKPYKECMSSELNSKGSDVKGNQIKAEKKGIEAGNQCASKIIENENYHIISGSSAVEDFNSYNSDHHGKMVLRNRQQNKNRLDDDISFEGHKDDSAKEKVSKKSGKGNWNKKTNSFGSKFVADEGCNVPMIKSPDECNLDTNKGFGSELEMDLGHMSSSHSHSEDQTMRNIRPSAEDDVICPICEGKFQQRLIETHATKCASTHFED